MTASRPLALSDHTPVAAVGPRRVTSAVFDKLMAEFAAVGTKHPLKPDDYTTEPFELTPAAQARLDACAGVGVTAENALWWAALRANTDYPLPNPATDELTGKAHQWLEMTMPGGPRSVLDQTHSGAMSPVEYRRDSAGGTYRPVEVYLPAKKSEGEK